MPSKILKTILVSALMVALILAAKPATAAKDRHRDSSRTSFGQLFGILGQVREDISNSLQEFIEALKFHLDNICYKNPDSCEKKSLSLAVSGPETWAD